MCIQLVMHLPFDRAQLLSVLFALAVSRDSVDVCTTIDRHPDSARHTNRSNPRVKLSLCAVLRCLSRSADGHLSREEITVELFGCTAAERIVPVVLNHVLRYHVLECCRRVNN